MAATRTALIESGYLDQQAPKLYELLDFVAVGTVADCVSLARSQNNRAIVTYGVIWCPVFGASQKVSRKP